jgi:hypothetical protein
VESDEEGRTRNLPPVRARRPIDRHFYGRLTQKSKAANLNTVIAPGIDVAADVAEINRGQADRSGDSYTTTTGRTYVLEASGTPSPRTGDGFYLLDRGTFKALCLLRSLGEGERTEEILRRMHDVGQSEIDAARATIRAIEGKG